MKMEIIGPLLLSILAGLSTMIGSLAIFIKIRRVEKFIIISLSFSMIILFIISVFELIPLSLKYMIKKYNIYYGIIISILVFMLGYQSISFIEKKIKNEENLYKIGIISFISIFLHNLPEGMAVFLSGYNSIKLGIKVCISIILHNIPEGILIAVPIYYSTKSRGQALKYTLLSSISEPLGALLSYFLLKVTNLNIKLSYILLFVSGLMISLVINDILKEILKYYKN